MLYASAEEIEQTLDYLAPKDKEADFQALHVVADALAAKAQKDMDWKKALKGPDRDKVVVAYDKEVKSLLGTILKRVKPGDKDYEKIVKEAISGRPLLDIKRNGTYKCRIVKQGFKEDKSNADGPGFNYYAHTARFDTVRSAIFRPRRGNRRLALKDISTAFLQSHGYKVTDPGLKKWLKVKNPLTGEIEYYEQSGPIYGEASAPIRWENTVAPWFEEQGFIRGDNEPCVFYHPDRDLLVVLYVDDCLADGQEEDITWIFDLMDERFACKDAEWLDIDSPLDYLGMDISMDQEYIYLSMAKYIDTALELLGWTELKPVSTPINQPVDPDSKALKAEQRQQFMTAMGCLGWLSNTGRPDISYSHSRIGQHMAQPTQSALDAIQRVFRYLKGSKDYCLRGRLQGKETSPEDLLQNKSTEIGNHWALYCDSDHAGNAETQNERKSQNGFVALQGEAEEDMVPSKWSSKKSSVAFAHPEIGEAHADISSSAAEVYCAANATFDILHLSYIVEEMGMTFKLPALLRMDNAAAEVFTNNSANKTRLKHIDCRQEWVKMLRNKALIKPVHVPSEDNLADIFTKILPRTVFANLRDRMMHKKPAAAV